MFSASLKLVETVPEEDCDDDDGETEDNAQELASRKSQKPQNDLEMEYDEDEEVPNASRKTLVADEPPDTNTEDEFEQYTYTFYKENGLLLSLFIIYALFQRF
jgi:hypothetical protein